MSVERIITIDGPSGSGKGTVAALVARRLGWSLLDSGALYRLVGLAALRRHIDLGDEHGVAVLAIAAASCRLCLARSLIIGGRTNAARTAP